MSTYGPTGGGTPTGGSSGYNPSAPTPAPSYQQPPAAPPPTTEPGGGQNAFTGPGTINFDLTDPQGAVQQATQQTGDLFGGLKSFLFGTDQPDKSGNHGGVLGIGDVPGLGQVLRGGADVVAGAGGALVGGAAAAVGGSLERIPTDSSKAEGLQAMFDALPDDSPAKIAAQKQIDADKGLFGTGILSGKEHYMSLAIQQHEDESVAKNPSLWSGMFRPSASLADTVSNLFGVLGAAQRGTERLIAGAGRAGDGGLNQLQMIQAVGDGNAVWTADDPGLSPVERTVYDMTKSGEWSDTQALDYLASHGAGLSHSKLTEIAGAMGIDPLNIATLGAGAIAKLGETGVLLAKTLDEAQAGLKEAELLGDSAKIAEYKAAVTTAQQGVKTGMAAEGINDKNLLGQLAKQPWTGTAARRIGALYGSMEGNRFGQAAKIVRTVIDPMHAIGGNPKGLQAIEEGSQDVTKAIVNAAGEDHHINLIQQLRDLPGGDVLAQQYNDGLAIYAGNVFRRVAGRQYRAVQMMMGRAESLVSDKSVIFSAMDAAVSSMKRRGLTQLEEEAGKFVKTEGVMWSKADDENLAQRAATLWGGRDSSEWTDDIAKMNARQKSLLHQATYGSAVKQLHAAKQAARAAGQTLNVANGDFNRLTLLNRHTLTDLGHEGILNQLTEAAADRERQIAIIEQARHDYPQLSRFVIDPTSKTETVTNFTDMMDRIKNYLPSQIGNAERPGLPDALRDFDSLITPSKNPDEAVFTIGFRPRDEFLWNLKADSDGVLRELHDPWLDQVSDNLQAYSPVRDVPVNIMGVPILGSVATKAASFLDHSEAVGRMALHGVTGTMITQAAHNKFVGTVLAHFVSEDGRPILTSQQVEGIWKSLMTKVQDSENVSGVRGLSEGAIWDTAQKVIPQAAKDAGLDRRSLLVHVLDAYDGDIRYIGLTQKLSGRVKAMLGHTFVGNTAGVIAEHAWPLLKFRLNPFFQMQEKVEPWVLNAQRGIASAWGTKMTDADRVAGVVFKNFVEKNLINVADFDIGEQSAKYLLTRKLESMAKAEGNSRYGRLAKQMEGFDGFTDVQGTKQLAMLRTFRKGVGGEMRAAWEEHMPGEFDKMLDAERARAGEVINEDDFAMRIAHQNLSANDIPISLRDGKPTLDFSNAILEGQWTAPQHLGEMRALNLDYAARRLGLTDTEGRTLNTSMDTRRALAAQRITMKDITRKLRAEGAHPDYIQRVESAYNFSYPEFFDSAQEAYGLTDAQRANIEGYFRRVAGARGMTPVEYMSQVYSPQVLRGTEGSLGSLGAIVQSQHTGLPVADLGTLRGIPGQTNIDDFYRQAAAVMAHHLDPSAKRAFLLDLLDRNGDGSIRDAVGRDEVLMDMKSIDEAFNGGAQDALSERIMHFMQGQPGTGPHDLVANELTGVGSVRDLATELRTNAGRPRNLQRFISHDSPEQASALADALEQMPNEYEHVATTEELGRKIDPAMVEYWRAHPQSSSGFKDIQFRALPRDAKASYQARVSETRAMYSRLIKPRSEGGLGLRVRPVAEDAPYADANAMREDIANGVIKVPRSGYWHPLLQNEDLFMERAVGDVFGHGQEANVLNSHDAMMNAAAMYSDEARASVLTDGFARKAWEEHSSRVIPQAVAEPQTAAEYDARYGTANDRLEEMATRGVNASGVSHVLQSRPLGPGARALPEDLQREAIGTLSTLRNQFPSVELHGFDIANNLPAHGVTLDYKLEHPTIVLSRDSGWQADPRHRQLVRDMRNNQAERMATQTEFKNLDTGLMEPRVTPPGVPHQAGSTPKSDLYHEFGHAVDIFLHRKGRTPGSYGSRQLSNFMRSFKGSESMTHLSEYAFNISDHSILKDSDMFAELFDMAFNPEHDLNDLYGSPLLDDVHEFRRILQDQGVWHPEGTAVPVNPHAGMTVGEANAAGAGIRAPFKMGTLPQETLDNVTGHFIGSGRYAESNPDVGRMAAYLREHTRMAVGDAIEEGTASRYAHMFDAMSGMPVTDAVPFDLTQSVMWHGAAQMMAAKWEDAFRLQYFAQNRSMLQRSLNHPMFGIYPASYMWGKIGPEMVKMIAKEPFGMKTGALGYSLYDLQKNIAVQRQYDPEFAKAIDGVGHSAALSFLGYMLPATPWDVPASYPVWLRNAAEQGIANNKRVANGQDVRDDNFIAPLGKALEKVFPMSTQLPFAARALGDFGNILPWNQQPAQPTAAPAHVGSGQTFALPPAAGDAPAQNAPASAPATGPVTGAGLGSVLAPDMQTLMDTLSGV